MPRMFARWCVPAATAAAVALGLARGATPTVAAATGGATGDATGGMATEARIFLPYSGRDAVGSPGPVTQFGGTIHGVVTDGRYAFAGIGPRLVVLDLETAGAPVPVWQSAGLPGIVDVKAIAQQRVWLTVDQSRGRYSLQAYDVHDPSAPRQVYDGAAPNDWREIIGASGNLLIARADGNGVGLIDISAPSRPVARGVATLSHGGYALRAVARGHHLYVTRYVHPETAPGPPGIAVIDIDSPDAPREVAFLQLPVEGGRWFDSPQVIDGAGDRLVAASLSAAWWIDVARPAVPRVVGFRSIEPDRPPDAATTRRLRDAVMVGRTTWLLASDDATASDLVALDFTDASRPRTIATLRLPSDLRLAHGGDRLVAYENGYGDAAMTVVDIARSEAPRVRGRFVTLGFVWRAWPLGDRLMAVSGESVILGTLGAARMQPDGVSSGVPDGAAPTWSSVASGSVVAAMHDEVWTLGPAAPPAGWPLVGWDVSDPQHPVERWHAHVLAWPGGFAAAGSIRYFGAHVARAGPMKPADGLWTFDTAEANATLVFGPLSGDANAAPQRLAIDGNRLFAATDGALWAVDISQPRAWREIARAPIGLGSSGNEPLLLDLSVEGGVVLVTTSAGVAAFDAADGAGLRAIGPLTIKPSVEALAAPPMAMPWKAASAAGRLYLLTALADEHSERLTAYDVTRPLAPIALWTRTYPGDLPVNPCDLAADARTIVIAACDDGVMVLDAP
ncbi:MAG: hypothetical protein ABI780_11520 [Ardenticatenales bacterium]